MEPTIQPFFQTNPATLPKQPRPIDGIQKRPKTPTFSVTRTHKPKAPPRNPQAIASPVEEIRPYQQPRQAGKAIRFWKKLQLPAILIGGLLAGVLIQNSWFGILATLAYGLISLVLHIPSRTTFGLAAVSLAAVCTMLLFKPDPQLIGNFSTYTFLLLIVGVIALTIEARPQERRKRRKGR